MRKLLLGIFAFVVAWLAVSLVLGLLFAVDINPVAALVVATVESPSSRLAAYQVLNGLFILSLTIALSVPVYRGFTRRWGGRAGDGAKAPSPTK